MGSLADDLASTPEDTKLGGYELGADGGEFVDVKTEQPITDWTRIFEQFNLDPNVFTILDDSVRVATWQQSKRLANGDRDVVSLFSYRARFTRKAAALVDVDEIVASLHTWTPPAFTAAAQSKTPVTMFVGLADWQLGKNEGPGKGTAETIQRVLDGFEQVERKIRHLQASGVPIEGILIANMGDHTEAVTGHYTSQTATVDMNQRDQLNTAIELNLTGIKTLAPLAEKITYAACLCNHGQWQRLGGKQITDDSDNSTGFIGDTLRTVCNLHPNLAHLDWLIPRDEMITTGTFSGVNIAMAHGHKISGTEENWLAKQSAWLHTTRNFKTDLWATAHRHTAALEDFGPYHRIQCTTNDPGSKSFTDATGKFSTQGTTTFLIGQHDKRRFSHYEVL